MMLFTCFVCLHLNKLVISPAVDDDQHEQQGEEIVLVGAQWSTAGRKQATTTKRRRRASGADMMYGETWSRAEQTACAGWPTHARRGPTTDRVVTTA